MREKRGWARKEEGERWRESTEKIVRIQMSLLTTIFRFANMFQVRSKRLVQHVLLRMFTSISVHDDKGLSLVRADSISQGDMAHSQTTNEPLVTRPSKLASWLEEPPSSTCRLAAAPFHGDQNVAQPAVLLLVMPP